MRVSPLQASGNHLTNYRFCNVLSEKLCSFSVTLPAATFSGAKRGNACVLWCLRCAGGLAASFDCVTFAEAEMPNGAAGMVLGQLDETVAARMHAELLRLAVPALVRLLAVDPSADVAAEAWRCSAAEGLCFLLRHRALHYSAVLYCEGFLALMRRVFMREDVLRSRFVPCALRIVAAVGCAAAEEPVRQSLVECTGVLRAVEAATRLLGVAAGSSSTTKLESPLPHEALHIGVLHLLLMLSRSVQQLRTVFQVSQPVCGY